MENRMNPWMGLSSYRDPQYENTPVMFCGREDEIFDLTRLVMGNIFVTLYGKSGNGKTSLLNAGVFPSLRKSGFIPVSVRLGIDAMDCSFQQAVIRKLRGLASESVVLETSDVVEMPEDESSQDYLWAFFARTRFTDADGRTVFPVIAFDQFEEVFTHRRQDAETLLCQIAFMMDESHALPTREIEGNIYEYDFNFRFIASIREDDLYKLEDSIDNCYLSSLKKCRFRLKALSAKGAREVILKPGAGLFDDADKEAVVEAILDKAKDNTSQGISANMLSLICSRLFEEINRAGAEHITLHIVESFIEANPFEKYFIEATSRLNNYEMKYLEDKLIDEYGRRKSISRKALEKNVRNAEELINGSRRIMQNVSSSSPNGDDLVELVHDTFCGPLILQKERRARRRRNKKLILNALGAVFVMVIAGFVALQD
ncbi:MAG: hypothetical protein PUA96_02630, partial [Bacteroidales bacterium]|nr:hypothetical protein [Bacteroidales bacterium]